MTHAELSNVKALLKKWRDERRLSVEAQRENLLGNVLEELTELARARSEHEQIDALCDVCVFTLNAIGDGGLNKSGKAEYNYHLDNKENFKVEKFKLESFVANITRRIYEENYAEQYKNLYMIIAECCNYMGGLGYDSNLCMLETIKEISSRVGKFDETIGKFVKDKSPEAQAKWYKADYSKCSMKVS